MIMSDFVEGFYKPWEIILSTFQSRNFSLAFGTFAAGITVILTVILIFVLLIKLWNLICTINENRK